ncbi:MAG: nucleotidyltransferase domain-containing protein [Nitrospirae bacterium YQR-1]
MEIANNPAIEDLLKILRNLKGYVRERYRAELRGVFGSYVRAEQRLGSDLDVLVEYDDGANLIDHVGLSLFLQEYLGLPSVDIVPESAIRDEIRQEVLNEKIPL